MELGRVRNKVIVAALCAIAGGVIAFFVNKRPQPPAPAPEPPRLGYSRNGSAPTPDLSPTR
ncbi:hypothetical protein [Nocardia aurantiaca]|uniref:Uncharacterized protein n=1 Tax=Nocardia aurantiaca TaxID=2675850 RepID=A0A6I3KS88_9NOCA|nr:hypothetical protein [Nocardia aurantiaca]MTE11936.1 hypothetical protein [Nocardia aurantiaca]